MRLIRVFLMLMVGLALTACGDKFRTYNGPEVTSIQVHKADRKMYLLHGSEVLETYDIHLGGNPVGKKHFEGDGKTPEGVYFISHRNPNSSYHLSLGISYPNADDRAYAKAAGKPPGGDIMIHGGPPTKKSKKHKNEDWTAGCIAVTDRQIETIYAMVKPGTPIMILP